VIAEVILPAVYYAFAGVSFPAAWRKLHHDLHLVYNPYTESGKEYVRRRYEEIV
jgi:hypothetical protein